MKKDDKGLTFFEVIWAIVSCIIAVSVAIGLGILGTGILIAIPTSVKIAGVILLFIIWILSIFRERSEMK